MQNKYRDIIASNNRCLYHISKRKYPYLEKLFTGEIRNLYFAITKFIRNKDLYRETGRISFHIETKKIIRFRHGGGYGTANHYINFICAMGLIRKNPNRDITDINQQFLMGKPYKYNGIGTYYILSFDPNGERLAEIESRCKDLVTHGITKANISKDKLLSNQLEYLAKELYPKVDSALEWKQIGYYKITKYLEKRINSNGFATKKQLYENVIVNEISNDKSIDKILRHYRKQLLQDFRYKKPSQAEKDRYNLTSDKWIFLKK